MRVYDFDDTIYNGDSSKDFILFEMKRHIGSFVKRSIPMCISTILYVLHIRTKETWKSTMFSFLNDIESIQNEVALFWDMNECKFKEWYKRQKRESDLIISASPYFLVKEGCRRVGISNVIATNMNEKTGKIFGKNCRGNAKVERFQEMYGEHVKIQEFYSDSTSDKFMAELAEKSYLVYGDDVKEWIL